jgi:hypothetical protein
MTISDLRCSLSRLFPGATVARSGKEDLRWIKNNKRLVAPNCEGATLHVCFRDGCYGNVIGK